MQTTSRSTFARLLVLFLFSVGFVACDSGDDGGDDPPPNTDTTPPALTSASFSGNVVTANFNEAVDPQSVTPAAFTLTPSVAITGAAASGSTVTLTMGAELDDEQSYVLTASGIRDTAGNASGATSTTASDASGGGNASQELGAAYPNAGDSRINLFNTDGDRFLLFNPVNGAVSDADDLNDVENGNIPLGDVGAAASVFGDEETVFWAKDGDTYTKYERDTADFDTATSFEEEYDDFGYDLNGVGAAYGSEGESIVIFNLNGTEWQEWFTGSDGFTSVFNFPADFGDGSAPISSVGAAFYSEDAEEVYLINRQGTQYTIYSENGFTAAFPVSELGDFEF